MREKELRLALVFFGGISLAVYMHGISKEILKLVRASNALHTIPKPGSADSAPEPADGEAAFPATDPEYDTEPVYFDLLRAIGPHVDLRVVVDIIAGASAGGINGVMLARALAHNLSFGRLRDLWLAEADVTELLAAERRARAWSKWFLTPLIWLGGYTGLVRPIRDLEVRQKLSLFVRSRWFRPPFDGPRMSQLMLDGLQAMTELAGNPAPSLLPTGQSLELFVTVTDFYGYEQAIQIHDPPLIFEREHRHILRFGCRHWPGGAIESDFELQSAPSLAFAARATSAFPGAFPPVQIGEMDRLLAAQGMAWPTRERFLARNFARYREAGGDPERTSFIDGSVLANKPFTEAIRAINGRAAYREVDRRLVYIDPDPQPLDAAQNHRVPGFFMTLKGALSDIPRNEPIADELDWVAGYNDRVRRLRAIVDAARPQIARLVQENTPEAFSRRFTIADIRSWREMVNSHIADNAGFAYEGYVRLKLASAVAFVGRTLARLCGAPERSPLFRAISETVDAWAKLRGVAYGGSESHRRFRAEGSATPRWLEFLLDFDIEFRRRRFSFLIQGQNRLYGMLDTLGRDGSSAKLVNHLKGEFYICLDELGRFEQPEFFTNDLAQRARALFPAPGVAEAREMETHARDFAERHGAELDRLIAALAAEIGLRSMTDHGDRLLADLDAENWVPAMRHDILINYLGFPFWDLLTFSVTSWRDAGEFDEIRIDRISPVDSPALRIGGASGLKGIDMGHFGAFFSRAYRENDYLLGRINAIERLIDIIGNAAGIEPGDGVDLPSFKRRAFARVIEAEAPHLPHIAPTIAAWRQALTETKDREAKAQAAPAASQGSA